jgi:hypothetical protein
VRKSLAEKARTGQRTRHLAALTAEGKPVNDPEDEKLWLSLESKHHLLEFDFSQTWEQELHLMAGMVKRIQRAWRLGRAAAGGGSAPQPGADGGGGAGLGGGGGGVEGEDACSCRSSRSSATCSCRSSCSGSSCGFGGAADGCWEGEGGSGDGCGADGTGEDWQQQVAEW